MNIIEPSFEILEPMNRMSWDEQLKIIELAARNCWQSEPDSNRDAFIKMLIRKNHLAMLEFGSMTVKLVTSRGRTHDIVRHRLFSFAQESSQYCLYKNEITVIRPSQWDKWTDEQQAMWRQGIAYAERAYMEMIKSGLKPQEAAYVLPNSTKATIYMKANFRNWMHFFDLRYHNTTGRDHSDMNMLVEPLYEEVCKLCPVIFQR